MGKQKEDNIVGKRFGRWTAIEVVYKKDNKDKNRKYILCKCDCNLQTEKLIRSDILKRGESQSCGCLHSEISSEIGKARKKYNTYDLTKEYGVGWTTNSNKEFYFDLEDYDKIKQYTWMEDKDGYIWCVINKLPVRMHRLLLNIINNDEYITDHKNRKRNDNRKNNIKATSYFENNHNAGVQCNNKTGKKGVHRHTSGIGYNVEIGYKGKYRRKYFKNLEDAINQRRE